MPLPHGEDNRADGIMHIEGSRICMFLCHPEEIPGGALPLPYELTFGTHVQNLVLCFVANADFFL